MFDTAKKEAVDAVHRALIHSATLAAVGANEVDALFDAGGLFRLYVVIPPGFSDILVFPSPDFQRDKAWENRKNGRPPTVPPRLFKRQYESLPATSM